MVYSGVDDALWSEAVHTAVYIRNRSINDDVPIPQSFRDAISGEQSGKWKNAMKIEYSALKQNKTWSLVDLPNGKKAIGSKWVFNLKKDKMGNIERFKARLVAKGCSQEFGVNYSETFSPVVRSSTIRMMFALAAEK